MPVPVGTDVVLHVGTQFYPAKSSPKLANVPKASGSPASVTTQTQNQPSTFQETLRRYLRTVNRTEILCLGIQSPHSSRVFDNDLICAIDELLLQIEVKLISDAES